MTRLEMAWRAERHYSYATRFPEGSSKYDDYMLLSWWYLLGTVGAPIWGNER